jgi:hypothetical protein
VFVLYDKRRSFVEKNKQPHPLFLRFRVERKNDDSDEGVNNADLICVNVPQHSQLLRSKDDGRMAVGALLTSGKITTQHAAELQAEIGRAEYLRETVLNRIEFVSGRDIGGAPYGYCRIIGRTDPVSESFPTKKAAHKYLLLLLERRFITMREGTSLLKGMNESELPSELSEEASKTPSAQSLSLKVSSESLQVFAIVFVGLVVLILFLLWFL